MEQALKGSHFIPLSCNNHCALLSTRPWKCLFSLFGESTGSSSKHTRLQYQIWLSAVSAIGIWQQAGPAAWSFVLTVANPGSVAFYPLWQLCRQKGWGKGKAGRRNPSSQFHMSFRSAIMSILWMEAETKRDKVIWPGSQGIAGTELRKEQASH